MNPLLSALIRVVLTCCGLAVTLLPRRLELLLGPLFGRFLLGIGRRRQEVAAENMRRCFPKLSTEERAQLLVKNFEHYGVLALELMHLFSPLPGHYRRYVAKNSVCEGFENWETANALGKGVMVVGSHLGNWELMAAGGVRAGIAHATMVTKYLKPEWLHKKIEASRLQAGVKGTYEPRTLPVVMRALRNKETIGFVMDQYAGPPMGIPVPFFGVKVGTLAAIGTLALRTGAAVVPAKTYRDKNGVIHICFEPMMVVTADNTEEKTTEFLASKVEGWVREYPSQWLWTHRRFKNVVWPEQLT